MIDYLKVEVKNINPQSLRANNLLEFHSKVNIETGEINLNSYSNAYYKGIEFKIFYTTIKTPYERITVEGSLHKYWNNGAHNFNDFGINELHRVIDELKELFAIYPENCFLRQLEVGLNITPTRETKGILKACIMHKTNRFKWIATRDEGNYIQVKYQRHIIKLYDKRTHYKNKGFILPNEIMRMEIKWLKMHELNQKGIRTLKDLLDFGLDKFVPQLIKEWNNVIYSEYKELQGMKYQNEYTNPNFWESLTYENLKYHRRNLKTLIQRNNNNTHERIKVLIKKKGETLNIKTTEINDLYIRLLSGVSSNENYEHNRKFCRLTGYNISMQRKDSFLLSHNGLKYYHKTDRKLYNEIKRKHLTKYWMRSSLNIQIKEIAHNIRNKYSTHLKNEKQSIAIKG